MLVNILENIGLTDKEARIYLAALEIGGGPVSAIALKAKMNRVTSYDILEKLIKKGLINFVTKNKVKFFSSTDPEIVVHEFQKRTADLTQALPDLKRLHGDTAHPKVRYFEGVEGIKAIYADTLTSKSEILNYCNSKEIRKFWEKYDTEYVAERVKNGIHLKGITPDDDHGRSVKAEDEKCLRETRLVNKDSFNFTNEINIYDDKVAIISLREEFIGMIIESHEIAETQRAIFHMVWDFAAASNLANMASSSLSAITTIPDRKSASLKKEKVVEPQPATDQAQLF